MNNFSSNSYSELLYKELLKHIKAEAKKLQLPYYCLFGDDLINALSVLAPRSIEELKIIPGLKDYYVNKYGESICQIINTFFDKNGLSSNPSTIEEQNVWLEALNAKVKERKEKGEKYKQLHDDIEQKMPLSQLCKKHSYRKNSKELWYYIEESNPESVVFYIESVIDQDKLEIACSDVVEGEKNILYSDEETVWKELAGKHGYPNCTFREFHLASCWIYAKKEIDPEFSIDQYFHWEPKPVPQTNKKSGCFGLILLIITSTIGFTLLFC